MDPEPSCALHAGGSRVTASGEVTVWFTQSREGAFPPNVMLNLLQHPSCHTDRRVQRQNQIPPKTPSLQRRLEPIASRRIAPRWDDRRDRPQPALGRRKKGSRRGAEAAEVHSPQLGSASIVPNGPKGGDEKWTLEPKACRAQTSSG
jgi:hypothetical protein